jgi:hypothetical protein
MVISRTDKWGDLQMNPKDLTYQAYKLYVAIRRSCHKTNAPSDTWNRLYSLETQAFYRYLRRLKSEDKYSFGLSK